MDKFAVFILTHGRPDRVKTYATLRRCGYTGDIYIICDNEDETLPEYQRLYRDKVIVFDKAAVAQTFDEMGIFSDRHAAVYARNASFQIARDLGLTFFLQMDDDYTRFDYRFNARYEYVQHLTSRLDALFKLLLDFYKVIPAVTIAIGQSGDYQGGRDSAMVKTVRTKRKVMNSFFCCVDRPFQFTGRINEDVNTPVCEGNRGLLFLTVMQLSLNQTTTQYQVGGMTDIYKDNGTYVKSFYTVMLAPSCVHVGYLSNNHPRLHHKIDWEKAVPCIVNEAHRK